jgi:hypothetical protein
VRRKAQRLLLESTDSNLEPPAFCRCITGHVPDLPLPPHRGAALQDGGAFGFHTLLDGRSCKRRVLLAQDIERFADSGLSSSAGTSSLVLGSNHAPCEAGPVEMSNSELPAQRSQLNIRGLNSRGMPSQLPSCCRLRVLGDSQRGGALLLELPLEESRIGVAILQEHFEIGALLAFALGIETRGIGGALGFGNRDAMRNALLLQARTQRCSSCIMFTTHGSASSRMLRASMLRAPALGRCNLLVQLVVEDLLLRCVVERVS